LREDDAVPSVPGTTLGERFTILGAPVLSGNMRLNGAGETALFQTWIGFGTNNDVKSLWIRDVSGELELVVRAGQTAPDTSGATFLSPDNFSFAEFNDGRELLFSGVLASGPGVIDGGNDRGLWLYDGIANVALVARGLDAAPGAPPGAAFSAQNFGTDFELNDAGDLAFGAFLVRVGDITTTNDQGIWGPDGAGGFTLRVREGDPVPGRASLHFGEFQEGSVRLNDLGEIVFLGRGEHDVDRLGFIAANGNVSVPLLIGDSFPVAPGDDRTITSIDLLSEHAFNDATQVALALGFEGGSSGIFRVAAPEPAAQWVGVLLALGAIARTRARRSTARS
jgi:hypothetical protein